MANMGLGDDGRLQRQVNEGSNLGSTPRQAPVVLKSRWTSLVPQLLSPLGPLLALSGMTDSW